MQEGRHITDAIDMLAPPATTQAARFAPDFGQRVLLTVDTEEEFDWSGPFRKDGFGLSHVGALREFQAFCERIGAFPVYLVDWPIVQCDEAVSIIADAVARGAAEVGVQLHPWVNPPHEEEVNVRNSFAGNLPPALEAAKFTALRDAIEERFAAVPLIYRAGRYGLGPNTAALLKATGIAIDTSVRANFDYSAAHGPDYSRHPLTPYWVDPERRLLELPVTSVFWGLLRKQGRTLYPIAARHAGVMARTGLLERIALTPEGVSAAEAIKGIDIALDDGLPLLVLSFHSPSLAPGHTPYVRDAQALEALYDWFGRIYAYLAQRGVRSASVAQILASVEA